MPVSFHFQEVHIALNKQNSLKKHITQLFNNEGIRVENITYIFCTDAFLLPLNKNYLNHDTYTDILTFDLSEEPKKLIAEIYISAERVKENAQTFGIPFEEELHRVIFHGALHLCGYDDHSEKDKALMRKKEDENIDRYLHNR